MHLRYSSSLGKRKKTGSKTQTTSCKPPAPLLLPLLPPIPEVFMLVFLLLSVESGKEMNQWRTGEEEEDEEEEEERHFLHLWPLCSSTYKSSPVWHAQAFLIHSSFLFKCGNESRSDPVVMPETCSLGHV